LVNKRAWRAKSLTKLLKIVDKDVNTTNAYGNTRAGNPPRTRVRRHRNTTSIRDPPTNLPINYYNDIWYDGLTNRQKRDLGAKDAKDIPEISDE
jgi:hypothetical protein